MRVSKLAKSSINRHGRLSAYLFYVSFKNIVVYYRLTGNLSGMRLFLASVLLHLLQCLQFNAHEINETIYKAEFDFFHSKINYIGVGVYPSVALFNHDCYPAVTR